MFLLLYWKESVRKAGCRLKLLVRVSLEQPSAWKETRSLSLLACRLKLLVSRQVSLASSRRFLLLLRKTSRFVVKNSKTTITMRIRE